MMNKRVLLLCGHYGSGKTNIAVNLAQHIKREYPTVTLADLDIVNPYFRSKDSATELEEAGIRLICSNYANSNVDIPALPSDLYALTDDRRMRAIIDVGGDDRGALVLGRLAPSILEENDYEMLMVINCYRPLTRDAASTVEVMREIEYAGGIRFTALVNNSNLGVETTAEDVLASMRYADEVAAMSGLPVVMTTADERLQNELQDKIPNFFPLKLQKKIQ
jgi:energy-coupling factor transporter ATP-binding protein EcfA2